MPCGRALASSPKNRRLCPVRWEQFKPHCGRGKRCSHVWTPDEAAPNFTICRGKHFQGTLRPHNTSSPHNPTYLLGPPGALSELHYNSQWQASPFSIAMALSNVNRIPSSTRRSSNPQPSSATCHQPRPANHSPPPSSDKSPSP